MDPSTFSPSRPTTNSIEEIDFITIEGSLWAKATRRVAREGDCRPRQCRNGQSGAQIRRRAAVSPRIAIDQPRFFGKHIRRDDCGQIRRGCTSIPREISRIGDQGNLKKSIAPMATSQKNRKNGQLTRRNNQPARRPIPSAMRDTTRVFRLTPSFSALAASLA